ncbi:hypothetical protein ATO6_01220 [Oceanicola sp. 22II-s10i]|uniref:DUF6478 family protein n=1 Tax=Oceanicola sp. 22II-s10i TaxID=1317116 RepID=UPI000B520E39|nr:DUF6478 family protein [Oceanicola sp. 22II-s10i]OWU85585.1 hypothetical protein ATO6_01220 [Oceanicola sp. 22II-s10i]
MAKQGGSLFQKLAFRRELGRWTRAARDAATSDLSALRQHRVMARQLKSQIDSLIFTAESRLALPRIGSQVFNVPQGADWSWRPEMWRGPLPVQGIASAQTKSMLGTEATLFHDCDRSELTLRQIRNLREEDLAPFGFRMDVFAFTGSFLSLVLDFPPEAVAGLKRRHLVRMDTIVEMEKPLEIFARLNIKHGPNTEQIVRELPLHEEDMMVEFDLAYSNLNEKRVERIWLDLIFEGPQMNQIVIRDLTFSRRPRAEL